MNEGSQCKGSGRAVNEGSQCKGSGRAVNEGRCGPCGLKTL